MKKQIVTLGSCYVDINFSGVPFGAEGLLPEREALGDKYELVAGGSALNFCRKVSDLGVLQPAFVGVIGTDDTGEQLKRLTSKAGIQTFFTETPDAQTVVGIGLTGRDGHHVITGGGSANSNMDERILPQLEIALQGADYLYLGGAYKLRRLMPHFGKIVQMAHEQNAQIVVDHGRLQPDTSPEHIQAVRGLVRASDIYFPSSDEFQKTWDVTDVSAGLDIMMRDAPKVTVIVKDGSRPVQYRSINDQGSVAPPNVHEVGNVTGAGDTFNAAVITELADGVPLRESIVYGCDVAANFVSKVS